MKIMKLTANMNPQNNITRREFARQSSLTAMAAAIPSLAHRVAAQKPDKLKLGLVGCGNRGTGAVKDCIIANRGVELIAMADLFPDQLEKSLTDLRTPSKGRERKDAPQFGHNQEWDHTSAIKVDKDHAFTGFDAFQKLMATDVDLVILATPPVFRPMHVAAAVAAGKHVFAEKPVGVDPVGVRSVMASIELARQKNLGFIGGTQLRWHPCYQEIMRRVHEGQIGEVTGGECYWYGNFMWKWHAEQRQPGWSDMEYQVRCWPQFLWTSGDNFVEMVIHNVDILNWAMRKTPERAIGFGGHVNWDDWPVKGNVYDHIYVEYDYGKGVRMSASGRQFKDGFGRVGERIVGTKGYATPVIGQIEGERPYKYEGSYENPRELQHRAFVDSIRAGRPLNEGQQLAESTMTVVLGRTAAYTGRMLNYSWVAKDSQLDLRPAKLELGPLPVAPLAVPGKTELI